MGLDEDFNPKELDDSAWDGDDMPIGGFVLAGLVLIVAFVVAAITLGIA